jgi:hypothetical protein
MSAKKINNFCHPERSVAESKDLLSIISSLAIKKKALGYGQ